MSTKTDTEFKIGLVLNKNYVAVVYNDGVTPMELVAVMLIQIFDKSRDDAITLTKNVHENGKQVVLKSSKSYVRGKVYEALEFMALHGYPQFVIKCEEE